MRRETELSAREGSACGRGGRQLPGMKPSTWPTWGMADRAAGDPRHALEFAARAIAVAARAPGLPQLVPVYNLAARLFIDADRMGEAASALQTGRRLTEERGFAWGQAECHALSAERLPPWGPVGRLDCRSGNCRRSLRAVRGVARIRDGQDRPGAGGRPTKRHSSGRTAMSRRPAIRLASAPGLAGRAMGLVGGRPVSRRRRDTPLEALRSIAKAWVKSKGIVSEEATVGPDLVRLAVRVGESAAGYGRRCNVDGAIGECGVAEDRCRRRCCAGDWSTTMSTLSRPVWARTGRSLDPTSSPRLAKRLG